VDVADKPEAAKAVAEALRLAAMIKAVLAELGVSP